jgi:hypothetical protein
VNSAGGDDVALAKSFIIVCEGPVLNWYSLLKPHSVCSWVDLKTKFMQAFQMFHDTTAESLDSASRKRQRTIAELHEKIHAAEITDS